MSLPPLPPGARLDDDDEEGVLPPLPPGATLDQPQTAPRPANGGPAATPENSGRATAPRLPVPGIVTTPVDGDTLHTTGSDVRLWGVDAPERKQQGWDRQGNAVEIGQQALADLDEAMARARAAVGMPVGQSYGRAVAPISVGGADLGQTLTRQGSALAAPDYLANDVERRFQYMQAERLARRNGLGIHDTYFQSPEDFRHSPIAAPDRETVAQFWDTPTPMAGMRPEAERQYVAMLNDYSVVPDAIVAFAKANGFVVDPANIVKAREAARKANQQIGIGYRDAPKPLTDLGDGSAGAAVRGAGSGALAGGLDELGAFADTAGLTPGRENVWNSDRRWADIWQNNQDQNAAILGYDELAHPYAQLGGEIAGGLIVPFGAKARTVPQLARVGALYGGAEGFLGTDGDLGDRAVGAAVGVPAGAAIGAAGGKALEYGLRAVPRLAERAGLFPRRAPIGAEGVPAGEFVAVASRARDVIDIGDMPPPPRGATIDPPAPVSTAYPGPSQGGRGRDWIDISEIPALPPGATLDRPRTSGALAMAAEPLPGVSQAMPRQRDYLDMGAVRAARLSDPMTAEQLRAAANDVMPSDVMPIASNQVGSLEEAAGIDAGRFAPARAPNERGGLTQRTVRAWNGALVPHRGPIDLVGWLRLNGGLRDEAGELRHMGLDNRGRSMDFAGQETRFGPLVNPEGMNFDDAALRAWEAGYFPDHSERPGIDDFLGALRDTHEGRNRRFLPDDFPEIDRFNAARLERYDLESQRFAAGQPIYADASAPATEPQPLPPVEAYEEWPAGGPDFAGNINLSKLDTPQDIKRALDFSRRQVGGFDAATRGRVSWAETERLAGELGMTPEKLLGRRHGQPFNAEEALAARQMLAKSGNELVNAARRIQGLDSPGDELLADFREKWMRHVAIQEQVAGMTAEAGRALQQFRKAADSRAVRGEVLAALVRGGGGEHNLKQAADMILDAAEDSPGKFNVEAARLSKSRFRHMFDELYINGLLSGLQTHTVNIVSNTLTALAQPIEHGVAAAIGGARQVLPGANPDRVVASEIGQRAFGLLSGAQEGARLFARALRSGEASDFISKIEGDEHKAIPGLTGEIVRMPSRFLTAEDEFFKGIARRMHLNGLAARQAHREGLRGGAAQERIAELSANPSDDLLAQSMDYARYLTFQQRLGSAASGISQFANNLPGAKLFLPFIRTPTNLLKFALERSLAAPALPEWRADVRAGGARRDLAIAKAMVGSGFGAAIYAEALNGRITGSTPGDPKKARLLYADGWQPYSIRLGDTWYSYKRLDPFSTTIGTAADLALLPEGMSQRQRENLTTLFVASILGNLASKTWLTGISTLVEAMTDPERNADKMLRQLAGSMIVPAGVAQVARVVDPVVRNVQTVPEAIQARLPGLSSSLPARRDVWGNEITNEGGVGPDILSPLWQSTARNDPVNRELLGIPYAPGPLKRQVGGRELTPQEYDRYQEAAGQRSYQAVAKLIQSPKWQTLTLDEREDAARKVVAAARGKARGALFPGSDRRGSSRRLGDIASLPPGATLDAASRAPNVFGELQQTIPGIRFTSGFRTPEYQADMRRRGYRPAYNSAHLDGSGLDMLPPHGQSLGWLRDQVQRRYPDARLLIHDGHLHGTFPGYRNAPVLGGAKAAGIHNPNLALPLLPPGAKLDP